MDLNSQQVSESNEGYDRAKALKEFDDTKAGVKGLVDAGITSLPRIFLTPPPEERSHDLNQNGSSDLPKFHVPTVDLGGRRIHTDPQRRKQVVEEIRQACEEWGFFQVTNHGISQDTLDDMIDGVRRFNDEPNEVKAEFYSRDLSKQVRSTSSFDLYHSKAASWRDTLFCSMSPKPPLPQELPSSCRDILLHYTSEVKELGRLLFQLVSEALGLEPNYLEDIDCVKGQSIVCNYYPPCPEPDRAIGLDSHRDPDFLTILLQDHIGGLQVRHQTHWVDIPPLKETLIVNVGDLLQLITNDKFKSVEHRVVAKSMGPRISISCFFSTHLQDSDRVYGPIKEVLTDERPAVFKGTLVKDFLNTFHAFELGVSALDLLRL